LNIPATQSDVPVSYVASASDNVKIDSVVYSIPTGSRFGFGAQVVTVTANDTAGNIDTCSFTVIVSVASGDSSTTLATTQAASQSDASSASSASSSTVAVGAAIGVVVIVILIIVVLAVLVRNSRKSNKTDPDRTNSALVGQAVSFVNPMLMQQPRNSMFPSRVITTPPSQPTASPTQSDELYPTFNPDDSYKDFDGVAQSSNASTKQTSSPSPAPYDAFKSVAASRTGSVNTNKGNAVFPANTATTGNTSNNAHVRQEAFTTNEVELYDVQTPFDDDAANNAEPYVVLLFL
jgi:hypothetical protein